MSGHFSPKKDRAKSGRTKGFHDKGSNVRKVAREMRLEKRANFQNPKVTAESQNERTWLKMVICAGEKRVRR